MKKIFSFHFPSKVDVYEEDAISSFFATKPGIFFLYFRVLSNFSNFAFSPLAHRAIAHSVCLVKDSISEPHPESHPHFPPSPSLHFPDCCSPVFPREIASNEIAAEALG